MAKNTKKPWQGRFSGKTDKFVEGFTSSIDFDNRLYEYDIQGSIAHSMMLNSIGILSDTELKKILLALEKVKKKIESGKMVWKDSLEDIHMHIEHELIELIGDTAKKIHTGRSRNDQVATDIRLYVRDEIRNVHESIIILQKTLITLAEKYSKSIIPGFTHLQVAQPMTFGFIMMAWFFMLERDKARYIDSYKRVNISPLGAGALSGSSHKLDREYTAKLLEFDGSTDNALDSVSDRDFIVEFISNSSLLMSHLSRFSEEIIIWCSTMYNFVDLDDKVCTGSSIMPQKKNPDVLELIRGKTGTVYGQLVNILTIMKAQPFAYNRDNQEDKPALFSCVDTVIMSVQAMNICFENLKLNENIAKNSAKKGYSTATDFADYLVKKQIPFRDAHEIVGKTVAYAVSKKLDLDELSMKDFKSFSSLIEEDIFDFLNVEGSVNSKQTSGGTSYEQVKIQIRKAKKIIKEYEKN
ncbi:MAG: argininosuccinate lyase [Gammaproteobacteria bacterium]|jgi:argininosuccinate lyase|nr:argininosuccinate lyase [Gammaproteobacteria bacterium]MBT7523001.1 argininosuccinate lyase [Gammaproteobacteria bacterium]MBT7814460.1 argininosuccinate lyase [Gammaproteobacteria bacterium]MDA9181262.1 argininosuccinate lyase [Gammaproteobacteria bacterium]